MEDVPPRSRGAGTSFQEVTASGGEEDQQLQLQAAPAIALEFLTAIIIAKIVFHCSVRQLCIPGLLLLIWTAISEHRSSMPALKVQKRKRDDKSTTSESDSENGKRQRQIGDVSAAETESSEIKYEHMLSSSLETSSATKSLRTILVENLSSLQQTLDVAKSELEDWDARNQHLIKSAIGFPDLEDNTQKAILHDGEDLVEKEDEDEDNGLENDDRAVADDEDEDKHIHDILEKFRPMLGRVSLERLPELASNLRQQLMLGDAQNELIDCVVNSTPLFGAYNILFRIEFSDGVTWLFKVAAIATIEKFDQLAAKELESEVQTMRMLKKNTTIPVPTIYAYDVTFNNVVNCPYIMMEFVQGTSLYAAWFDESASDLEERRARSLRDIASAMVQLRQFQCGKGGSLLFDESGKPTGAGSMRVVDDAVYLQFEDEERYGKVYERGPYSDPTAMITRHIDLHKKPEDEMCSAIDTLMRLFLSWIPHDQEDPTFVLHHPDFAIQNFLVAEDGSLMSIIDWDGVCFQPKSIGNESYPDWLTHDWNPYYHEREYGMDGCLTSHNTTEELIRYRAMYAGFIEESKASFEGHSCTSMTRMSLPAGSLALAASTPYFGGDSDILTKIVRELSDAIPDDPRKFCSQYEEDGKELGEEDDSEKNSEQLMLEIARAVDQGTLSEERMGWLRDGFAALVQTLKDE